MDFSAALPTFLITLREGVEATLVVGIVLAYLAKAKQSQFNSWVYAGVAIGVLASALVGVLFNQTLQSLESANQHYAPVVGPLLEAVFSLLAIVLLSWMLIWMTRQARFLKAEVEEGISAALEQNQSAGWGIFGLIFFAVMREGFETVLFIAAQFQEGWMPAVGAAAGLLTAVGIGLLLFRWGVKINLRQFFQVMGVLLLLIVGGLVISALGHFDLAALRWMQIHPGTAGICLSYDPLLRDSSCFLGPMVWNGTQILPQRQFPGVILRTLFGYTDRLYLLEAIGYGLFWLTVGRLYFQNLAPAAQPRQSSTPSSER